MLLIYFCNSICRGYFTLTFQRLVGECDYTLGNETLLTTTFWGMILVVTTTLWGMPDLPKV